MRYVIKQPAEKLTQEIDFTQYLGSGVTVSSATVAAVRLDTGAAYNTLLTSTTATVASPLVSFQLAAQGESGVDYRVEVSATLSNGDIKNIVIPVRVREA